MTTIIYHRGGLATDSKIGRHLGTQAERFTYGEKVYASPCGRCYITKAGTMYTPESNQQFAEELMELVKEFEDNKHLTSERMMKSEVTQPGWLIITRDTTLYFEGERCCHLEDDDWVGLGSGAVYAKAAVAAGKNPREAVDLTYQFDSLSGGPIWCYHAQNLKPLREAVE